jgi:predicted DCC family thiol-disulfide oxidoreductase YuxK
MTQLRHKVFYDGKCGLCRREIAHYRMIDTDHRFDWLNVFDHATELEEANISLLEALERLHVIEANGKLHIGVDAFIIIWRDLTRWRYCSMIASNRLIKPLLTVAYDRFARWRFNRNRYCQL